MINNTITLTISEFRDLLISSADLGAQQAMKRSGKLKDEISQSQAFTEFGRNNVQSWFADGLLNRTYGKNGKNRIYYSRIQLQAVKVAQGNRPSLISKSYENNFRII